MIEQIPAMAKDAVGLIQTVLLPAAGLGAAKAAAGAAGKAIFDWCKAKLIGSSEAEALAKLEGNPQSAGAANMLMGALQIRLESDQELLRELATLLKEATGTDYSVRQSMDVAGDSNRTAQIAGHDNTVNIR